MKSWKNKFILILCACFSLTLFLSFSLAAVTYAEEIKSVYDEFQSEGTQNPQEENNEQQGQNAQQNEQIANEALNIGLFDYVKVIFMLLLVIALLYLFLRFLNKKSNFTSGKELLQNLGGISLGSNKNVQVLKMGKKLYLVGVGENVNLLKEINEEEEVDAIIALYNERVEKMFITEPWIRRVFGFKGKSDKHQVSEPAESDFKELFEKQLVDIGSKKQDVFELLGKNREDQNR